ncbi:hypothetical protein R3W88_015787 [Solanum pinnatisectum]|uniref:Pentatricopeptide repeat-containing protein n=1 Tax=Solanum pinnatisectum TaxID=50273 RepID=A0AAV9KVY9_9SOLN|nr:hypothetical protein R3W88_015787 [Solanum pinnatisectum]
MKALKLFKLILNSSSHPNHFTFSTVLDACAGYSAILLLSAIFESIPARNSIIGGYARHGLAERAMQEFERMLKSGIRSGSIARSMWLALMSRARRDCSKWNLHIGARPSCIILGAFQNLWIQRSMQ